MEIAELFKQLETQASTTGKISLDTSILSAPQTALIQKTFGLPNGQFLTISGVKGADVTLAGDSIAISAGTVDVLNRQALGTTTTFTAGAQVDVVLAIAMPKAWAFADSFADLTGFPFDLLSLSECYFVYSTRAVARYPLWSSRPVDAIALAQGLNFGARLSPGPLTVLKTLLDALMPSEPLNLWGPVEAPLPKSYPVMSLSADLGVPSFELLPELTITGLRLALQITEPDADSTQNVVIGVEALTKDLEFLLGITEDATSIFVSGTPLSTYQATLDSLASCTLGAAVLPKGTSFSDFVPGAIADAFKEIRFNGFDMSVAVTPKRAVNSIAFAIGEKAGSSIDLGLFDLTGFDLRAAWMDPLSADSTAMVGVTAQAKIPLEIFVKPVDFSISIAKSTGWAITDIEACYRGPETVAEGAITLASLIKAVAPRGTVVPDELNDLIFTEFLLDVDPSGKSFSCECQGTFDCVLFSHPFDSNFCLTFTATKKDGNTDYTVDLKGGFNVDQTEFSLVADLAKAGGSTSFQFTATAEHIPLSDLIKNLFQEFSLDLSVLPEIVLSNVTMNYNTPTDKQVGIEATFTFADTGHTGACAFVAEKKTDWEFVAVASLGTKVPIDIGSHLPLVGKELTGEFELKAGYLVITSKNAAGMTLPDFPDLAIKPGVSFTFDLLLAGQPHSVVLPLLSYGDADSKQLVSGAPADGAGSAPGTLSIQKQIGPVFIESLGLSYTDQVLACALNATIALGPLSMSMNGFSFGSKLTAFTPSFNLSGLGLSYSEPPLTIAGEFVNVSKPGAAGVQFEGGLVIGTGDFTVHAFGYYGSESGFSSMFIFGDIAYDFGGPPAFFVTGIALGFGYNSTVTLPTIDEVAAFPFIQVLPTSAVPNPGVLGGPNASPLDVLNKILSPTLHDPPWVHEAKGSLWLAAGITFTSFELVNSQALVVVDAGSELVIDLIGTSRAEFPQAGGEVSYANIELDLLVRFAPSEGLFSLQAVLASGSYLLDKACVLTGGFAFFVWFEARPGSPGSLHQGDFVLTLGGYSPGFTCDYYPTVPPVGFHWALDSTITIQGSAYFALTPAALMAGGALKATYQSGNLKAWFDAHADFIVRWKPFWFDADIGIVIGASYTIDWGFTTSTISVELGCDLQLWGPRTGGSATLDFYVISVTIPFGTPKNNSQSVSGWTDVEKMLPNTAPVDQPRNVLTLSPVAGVIPNGTTPVKNDGSVWIVRGTMFAFTTSSSIPMTSAIIGGTSLSGGSFNVYPLVALDAKWNNVSSQHTVTIRDSTGAVRSSSFEVEAVHAGVPAALWGSPAEDANGKPQVPDAAKLLVPNQLTGVSLRVNAPTVGHSAGAIDVQANLQLDELNLASAVLPVSASAPPAGDTATNGGVTISRIGSPEHGIASSTATAARQAIFDALTSLHYAPDANDPMTRFRDQIGCSLNAEPLLVD